MKKTTKQIAEDCGIDSNSLRPSTLEKIMNGIYTGSTLYEESLYEIIGALYRRIEKLEEEADLRDPETKRTSLQVNCRKCGKFTPGKSVSRDKIVCAICGEAL